MYAVVKTGGKQHKVVVGETVSVELLDADAGSVITLPVLLINDGEKLVTGEDAAAATVTAEVLGHGKADKVIVFKFKKRKGYKRTRGHRQNLTLVKVTDIALAGAKKAPKAKAVEVVTPEVAVEKPAAKKAVAKPAVKKTETAAVEKKPAAKKPVAKKADGEVAVKKPAVKKPAAKKPAAKKPAAKKPAAKKPAVKKTTTPAESAE
ncbi:MAG TPA: 50S ribosomal protein L21 [Coriobacteriia bacterium]